MNLTIKRNEIVSNGAFGEIPELELVTLEHTYSVGSGFAPKLPPGTYICVRGIHSLLAHPQFETFEITGVPGHSGILFHRGNDENDSEGCVLQGMARQGDLIIQSRDAFAKFMNAQEGVMEFQLLVMAP